MDKIKLTKGELKKQRDSLKQYERYLPTLLLKKQQLQMELLHQYVLSEEKAQGLEKKKSAAFSWAGLLSESDKRFATWIKPKAVITAEKNVAGVDIPVFSGAEFPEAEYDLFLSPLWFDHALEALKAMVVLQEELAIVDKGIEILKHELRITTQRVNLFEKVKIPETKEAIRVIKIYIGDQMANAVGRCKIAKNKIEKLMLEEVAA